MNEKEDKGGNKPTLTIDNSPIRHRGVLSFHFSGFPPNTYVYVYSDGKGVNTVMSDKLGKGPSIFTGIDLPGDHVLEARDNFNHKATALFVVLAQPEPEKRP